MKTTPLSERDQLRALVVLAASCGASRVANVVEARTGFGDLHRLLSVGPADVSTWMPIVGGFLGAGLVRACSPRFATSIALSLGAGGGVLAYFGHEIPGGLLSLAATGAFTVGSLAFAGEVLVPDESDRSPSRFAGIAGFVLARAALMDLGTFAWWTATSYGDRGSSHLFAAALKLIAAVAVFFARPSSAIHAAAPIQPVYRGASELGEPEPARDPALEYRGDLWEALRPLVFPTILFQLGTVGAGYVMAGAMHWLIAGVVAAAAAAHFFNGWRERKPIPLVDLYARGLMLGAGGWFLVGLSSIIGALMLPGAIIATLAGVIASFSLGFVAIAGHGRRAALPLAGWMALQSGTTIFANAIFGAMPGMLLIPLGLVAFFAGPGLRRIATEVETRLSST